MRINFHFLALAFGVAPIGLFWASPWPESIPPEEPRSRQSQPARQGDLKNDKRHAVREAERILRQHQALRR